MEVIVNDAHHIYTKEDFGCSPSDPSKEKVTISNLSRLTSEASGPSPWRFRKCQEVLLMARKGGGRNEPFVEV